MDYSSILSTFINSIVNDTFKDKVGLEKVGKFSSVEFQHKDYFIMIKKEKI